MPKYEDTETSLPRRAHHSMPRQSMPTSKPNDMKQILILILCAFVLSCKSTKTVSSSYESERNAVSQAQWRSTQNLSFSSLQRLTALSLDSCVVVFGGADTSATPLYSSFRYQTDGSGTCNKAKHHIPPMASRQQSLKEHLPPPSAVNRRRSKSTDYTFPKRKRRSP